MTGMCVHSFPYGRYKRYSCPKNIIEEEPCWTRSKGNLVKHPASHHHQPGGPGKSLKWYEGNNHFPLAFRVQYIQYKQLITQGIHVI